MWSEQVRGCSDDFRTYDEVIRWLRGKLYREPVPDQDRAAMDSVDI